MFTIQNNLLTVSINENGAELNSIFHKQHQLEYLWSADPAFWAKKSPVLFPIVGTLKNNSYYFGGKQYQLSRHGFAREKAFHVSGQSENSISFSITDDAQTRENYPFRFVFKITYSLQSDQLSVEYHVANTGDSPMYFSVGGHPAFRVPLTQGSLYSDYFLEFSTEETAGRWPISKDGLIENEPIPLLDHTTRLPLAKNLFYEDALVFKHLNSESISLKSSGNSHGLTLFCTGFPYLGIWAAKDADFVCIEPWYGIADAMDSNQQLTEKEGINKLEPGLTFRAAWGIKLF